MKDSISCFSNYFAGCCMVIVQVSDFFLDSLVCVTYYFIIWSMMCALLLFVVFDFKSFQSITAF